MNPKLKLGLEAVAVVALIVIGYEVVARLTKATATPTTAPAGNATGNPSSGVNYGGLINSGGDWLFSFLNGVGTNQNSTNSTSGVSSSGQTFNNDGTYAGDVTNYSGYYDIFS